MFTWSKLERLEMSDDFNHFFFLLALVCAVVSGLMLLSTSKFSVMFLTPNEAYVAPSTALRVLFPQG
jgi:cytochrome b subunit of formate dehydrogenase